MISKKDKKQKKFILEFVGRIFRLTARGISKELKMAYEFQTISLEELSAQLHRQEAMEIGEKKGLEKGRKENRKEIKALKEALKEAEAQAIETAKALRARGMPISDIAEITHLDESFILSLR